MLDEIEDFSFDVMHLPCSRNPTDLGPRLPDGDGPPVSTRDPDPESQQELFSWLGRDAPVSAVLAVIHSGWATHRSLAAVAFTNVEPRDAPSSTEARGGANSPQLGCLWP